MPVNLRLRPRPVAMTFGAIAVILAILSLITEYLVEFALVGQLDEIIVYLLDLFSVNLEESIPTWYSVLLLFGAAVLLGTIAFANKRNHQPHTRYWMGLAGIFLYLSMDEGVAIHEIFASPLQVAFGATGALSFGWQILAVPVVIIVGLLFLRFVRQLPRPTMRLFIIAGVVYLGGALVVEGISAHQWSVDDTLSMTYLAIATVEELFEMLGVVVFIYALLDYMDSMAYNSHIAPDGVSEPPTPQPQGPLPPAGDSHQTAAAAPGKLLSPMTGLILFLIVTNVLSLAWILSDRPVLIEYEAPFYQAVVPDMQQSQSIFIEFQGVFGIDADISGVMLSSFLDEYEQVIVVALPDSHTSVLFAGDNLPIDRDTLTALLHHHRQFEFLIFETETVRLLAENMSQ